VSEVKRMEWIDGYLNVEDFASMPPGEYAEKELRTTQQLLAQFVFIVIA